MISTFRVQSTASGLCDTGIDRVGQVYTGGTVRAKKLSLKSLALSGLFGAKWSFPKKSFS